MGTGTTNRKLTVLITNNTFHTCNLNICNLKEIQCLETLDPECGQSYFNLTTTGDLIIKVADAIYANIRDSSSIDNSSNSASKEGYRLFRVNDLKIKDGQKFAFCYEYLKPEQIGNLRRKYCHNEVIKCNSICQVPLDTIKGICSVLDVNSYCEGRSKGIEEKDVYVCEFQKAPNKPRLTMIKDDYGYLKPNTDTYVFDVFESKLTSEKTSGETSDSLIR